MICLFGHRGWRTLNSTLTTIHQEELNVQQHALAALSSGKTGWPLTTWSFYRRLVQSLNCSGRQQKSRHQRDLIPRHSSAYTVAIPATLSSQFSFAWTNNNLLLHDSPSFINIFSQTLFIKYNSGTLKMQQTTGICGPYTAPSSFVFPIFFHVVGLDSVLSSFV